jgi:hypothetical protein
MAVNSYIERYDLSALHASFLNSKSRGRRLTAASLIGRRPILSDEKESELTKAEILTAFKKIFPNQSGKIEPKQKKKKRQEVKPNGDS